MAQDRSKFAFFCDQRPERQYPDTGTGYVPPEVEELRELRQLEAVGASGALEGERLAARRRMEFLLIKREQSGMARVAQAAWDQYAEKVAARLAETKP